MNQPKYKRILLKLSGEAISGGTKGIIDFEFLETVATVIKKCVAEGTQIAVMIGAGNIWRGKQSGRVKTLPLCAFNSRREATAVLFMHQIAWR